MWTQALPDAPGVYWMKLGSDDPRLITVIEKSANGSATFRTALISCDIPQLTGAEFWEGPIQPPA